MHTYEEMIAEVRRELAIRRRVYPKFVSAGRITQEQANESMARMESVLDLLLSLQRHQPQRNPLELDYELVDDSIAV